MRFFKDEYKLTWRHNGETVCIEPSGKDSLRIRAIKGKDVVDNLPGALLKAECVQCEININEGLGTIVNGLIRAEISNEGKISFYNNKDNRLLTEEIRNKGLNLNRSYKALSARTHKIEVMFRAFKDEHIYGLGQHRHGFLDQKGCVIELAQNNADVSIPFMVSCKG